MRAPWGVLLLTVLAGAIVLAPAGTASGKGGGTIIRIKGNRNPHFVVPDGGVQSGSTLRVINKTNPQAIGPHTFSLVVPSDIPRTNSEDRDCFHGHHICRRIAKGWHQFDFQTGIPAVNPVDPGSDGWDQEGRLDPHRKGDSFFFSNQDEGLTETVSASSGTVLHFMCAVHPFMHGHIDVN
jgi:hypothetical protein